MVGVQYNHVLGDEICIEGYYLLTLQHNFTDGMALGSAFLLYGSVGGWSRTLFLLAHELPQEVRLLSWLEDVIFFSYQADQMKCLILKFSIGGFNFFGWPCILFFSMKVWFFTLWKKKKKILWSSQAMLPDTYKLNLHASRLDFLYFPFFPSYKGACH